MRITVDIYKQTVRYGVNKDFNLSKLAFIKHMATAGMGRFLYLAKLRRLVGMFLTYGDFLRDFNSDRFSKPVIYDPTEVAQFSNLAARAIADFLSKEIDRSKFTVVYEHYLKQQRIPLRGNRPDLIAFTEDNRIFAIEAKGRSEGYESYIRSVLLNAKKQARSGPIPVNFAVACVC